MTQTRIQSILAGASTRQQKREHFVAVMQSAVESQVSDAIQLEDHDDSVACTHFGTQCDSGGRFSAIAPARVVVILEDEAARGFCIDKPASFDGMFEGLAWSASVRGWKRVGDAVELKLDVE